MAFLVLGLLLAAQRGAVGVQVRFDNSTSPSTISLACPGAWTLELAKEDGSIRSITGVSSSRQPVVLFSSDGPAWALRDPTPTRGTCPAPIQMRKDCGYYGISKAQCLAPDNPKSDGLPCCWAANEDTAVQNESTSASCQAPPAVRQDCGYEGMPNASVCLSPSNPKKPKHGSCCWIEDAVYSKHPVGPQCYSVKTDPGGPVCYKVEQPRPALTNHDGAFSYIWNPSNASLSLRWDLSAAGPTTSDEDVGSATVEVIISAAGGSRWFDAVFVLHAAPTSDATYGQLEWPASLEFDVSRLGSVWYPMLPGLRLRRDWFTHTPTGQMIPYPGSGTFAETVHFNLSATAAASSFATVSVSTVSGPDLTIPHFLGFVPSDGANLDGQWQYKHQTNPNVTAGCDPFNTPGSTPCALGDKGTIRTRFSFGGTPDSDMALYGLSNGLLKPTARLIAQAGASGSDATSLTPVVGAGPLPPIATKMPHVLLDRLAKALFMKLDVTMNYSTIASNIYPHLKMMPPGLIHFVGFEPHGFDRWYPDYLPPNPQYGTGCTLALAMDAAKALGHLVMPYTNPTWWDVKAPTLNNLSAHGLTLADVTCQNSSRLPQWETYQEVPVVHTGVATELDHPYVFERWQHLMRQVTRANFTSVASGAGISICDEKAVQLPSDLIFEDQLGARHAYVDYNPGRRGMGALGYQQSMIDHARNFSHYVLGTEQGFDKLARWESGFYGHILEMEVSPEPLPYPFGHAADRWEPYPLSQVLFGETLTYQVHNLANSAFANSLNQSCWVLASGGRLSIDINDGPYWSQGKAAWFRSIGLMQHVGISRWLGYPQISFERSGNKSLTVMKSAASGADLDAADAEYHIVTSWGVDHPLPITSKDVPSAISDGFVLPPGGCAAYGSDGDFIGGWFLEYNNRMLTPPMKSQFHAIVEDRTCTSPFTDAVCVYHAMGPDTPLDIHPPAGCAAKDVVVSAVDQAGTVLRVSSTTSGSGTLVTFTATAIAGREPVDFYALHCAD